GAASGRSRNCLGATRRIRGDVSRYRSSSDARGESPLSGHGVRAGRAIQQKSTGRRSVLPARPPEGHLREVLPHIHHHTSNHQLTTIHHQPTTNSPQKKPHKKRTTPNKIATSTITDIYPENPASR